MKPLKQIGVNLKSLRKSVDEKQERLAKVLKISQGKLSKVERGESELSSTELKRAANFFSRTMDYFFDGHI